MQKPMGHHEVHPSDPATTMEMHAPDPETHGHGVQSIPTSKTFERSRLCPACKSPTHPHDLKCPWCGVLLAPS
jgi:hypothetical protein